MQFLELTRRHAALKDSWPVVPDYCLVVDSLRLGYVPASAGRGRCIVRRSRPLPPNTSRGIPFRSALSPPAATQKEEKLAGAHRSSGQPTLRSLVLSQHSPTFEFSCCKKNSNTTYKIQP
ncbi:hypothetical protein TNCV_4721181 [Trichonephila clavipes]|uniref:Uncharacterized protein n=1 Tax=Trichonephila clavipes TaxID=2585209 RepID=A0A8X6W6H2_TRICX|nr:hypothetical protein TNCV_4721181 [Trichonephila clavipes]